ncbi:SBBP repeat-containing protein [Limnospira indica]|uniref:SBBP repeat-containing protein n=1 Tax=Limnospira indica TaxID=147322 RepID=UPI00061B23BD|nr:SBBP repeat-containing protein [Limnospira indica]QNH58181.1 MAG: SBBP repeat-containing protein [Limnospira indica BM01]
MLTVQISTPPEFSQTWLLETSYGTGGNALTTGLDGSIYITGSTREDLNGEINQSGTDSFIVKYEPDGTLVWTRLLGGNYSNSYGNALTTGLDGSIYMAGWTRSDQIVEIPRQPYEIPSNENDVFLARYEPDGSQVWTTRLASNRSEIAHALTTGLDGSIYVAGFTSGDLGGEINNGGTDAFISKYEPDGTLTWTRLLGTSNWDGARALTTGFDGSIYMAGETWGDLNGEINQSGADGFIAKYEPDGTLVWTRLLGSNGWGAAHALTTGIDGFIYVAGLTEGDINEEIFSRGGNALISKYEPEDGALVWTTQLGTPNADQANALTTGLDGSIYMAGWTQGNLAEEMNRGYSDGFIAKYETDGALAWTRLLASNDRDTVNDLTTGIDGSIYMAGNAFVRVIVDGTVAEPVPPPPEFIDPLLPLNGDYIPIAGDFNGSGITDILWYAPGPDPDFMWYFHADGSYGSRLFMINGYYIPIAGDFNGSGITDILWYAPGPDPDFMWYFNQDGNYDGFQLTVDGHYAPVPADLEVF